MKQLEILDITTTQNDDMTVVKVCGDIDLSNSGQLKEVIEGICQSSPRSFVALDIRETPFIDSAGLALIVQMKKHLAPACLFGILIERGSQPERVLQLGRFDTFLPVKYTLEDVRSGVTI